MKPFGYNVQKYRIIYVIKKLRMGLETTLLMQIYLNKFQRSCRLDKHPDDGVIKLFKDSVKGCFTVHTANVEGDFFVF